MGLYDPVCTIECDKCGSKDEYEMVEMAYDNIWSAEGAVEYFTDNGWTFNDDMESFCPGCSKDLESPDE